MTGEDVSLYFHIPFCSKKCPYCHFFVLPNEERFKTPFLEALHQEWDLRAPQLQGKNIVSIYFGGGTPSKLPPSCYAVLLEKIQNGKLTLDPHCEITLEANPEDVTPSLARDWAKIGINRVSVGVQSLLDSELVLLERTHNAQRSRDALAALYEAGINNLSIDLLFELPRQTKKHLEASLQSLKKLPLTHLSLYNLTLEPHTVFFKKKRELTPLLPPEEERLEMLNWAVAALEDSGLQRYEISAFAKPGKESVHNTGYWTARPFLGLGPSAFSYWGGSRFSNTMRFHTYLSQLKHGLFPIGFEETLPHPSNVHELFVVQLRLTKGIHLPQFTSRHGPLPPNLREKIEELIVCGWLERNGEQIKLSKQGLLIYDSVAADLI